MPQKNNTQEKAVLLTAEAEYLKKSGWVPLAPQVPGGEVRWRDQDNHDFSQKTAVGAQKARDEEADR